MSATEGYGRRAAWGWAANGGGIAHEPDGLLPGWLHLGQNQAAHVRAKAWQALDIKHVAEELESLGHEPAHAVESHLATLLLHLLKMGYQRQRRRSSVQSINHARRDIALRLKRNPGLQPELPEVLAWAYPRARKDAARETPPPLTSFPEECPWTLEQILDEDFFPEA